MNETEIILNRVANILKENKLIKSSSVRNLSNYFNISHTIIYKQIKLNRLSIKMFKNIKTCPVLKEVDISTDYIINRILECYD